jgi:hypothetical protein
MERDLSCEAWLNSELVRVRFPMQAKVYRLHLTTRWGATSDGVLLVHLGDLDLGQIPYIPELQFVRELCEKVWDAAEKGSWKPVETFVIFPPVLYHQVVDDVDVFFLGNVKHNILPSLGDNEACTNIFSHILDPLDFLVFSVIPEDDRPGKKAFYEQELKDAIAELKEKRLA